MMNNVVRRCYVPMPSKQIIARKFIDAPGLMSRLYAHAHLDRGLVIASTSKACEFPNPQLCVYGQSYVRMDSSLSDRR